MGKFEAYRISEVTFTKLSVEHIPYFTYCKVVGPHGGAYMLDTFCTERLLESAIMRRDGYFHILPNRLDTIMNRLARENGIEKVINYETDDKSLRALSKIERCKPLIRLTGKSEANYIGYRLDKRQVSWL